MNATVTLLLALCLPAIQPVAVSAPTRIISVSPPPIRTKPPIQAAAA